MQSSGLVRGGFGFAVIRSGHGSDHIFPYILPTLARRSAAQHDTSAERSERIVGAAWVTTAATAVGGSCAEVH